MTQEEKHLLFKELCTRLPYGVRVCVDESGLFIPTLTYIEGTIICHFKECAWTRYIDTIKPYLRSMTSMTEEEKEEFNGVINEKCGCDGIHLIGNEGGYIIHYSWMNKCVDWLDKKMFDHRGLIPMGLALEALEGMYKTE